MAPIPRKTFFAKIKAFALAHKVWSGIIAIAILFIGYKTVSAFRGTATETRYVTAAAEKGTIIASVSGSGQISASNQVDIKAKASGDVTAVVGKEGQFVKAGTAIAYLDATDAQKAVRDAEISLETAELSLQKLQQPADNLSLIQSQNSLANAKQNLVSDYDNGFTDVADAFLEFPGIMSGLHDVLYTVSGGASNTNQQNIDYYTDVAARYDDSAANFKTDAETKYNSALAAYNKNFSDYKATSRSADTATIERLITESYATAKSIDEALKSANNLIQFYEDKLTTANMKPVAAADQALTTLNGYTSKANTHVQNLLSASNSITDAKNSIAENTASLVKLQAGADPLDVQSNELSLQSRKNALLDAQQNLSYATIRAPFDGTIAKLTVKKGDSVSSGGSIGTFITSEKIAVISENEVDIAKIKVGQKATLTFDAIDGLTIAGEVEEVDSLGTVSQGVVNYDVTIKLLSDDDRIKSGMSISVAIITDIAQDVLTVPASAVKSNAAGSYVEVFDAAPAGSASTAGAVSSTLPRQVSVTTGLSDDTSTQILSGLKEGDIVVTRTITTTAAKPATAASATSLLGGTRAGIGGGAVRATGARGN